VLWGWTLGRVEVELQEALSGGRVGPTAGMDGPRTGLVATASTAGLADFHPVSSPDYPSMESVPGSGIAPEVGVIEVVLLVSDYVGTGKIALPTCRARPLGSGIPFRPVGYAASNLSMGTWKHEAPTRLRVGPGGDVRQAGISRTDRSASDGGTAADRPSQHSDADNQYGRPSLPRSSVHQKSYQSARPR